MSRIDWYLNRLRAMGPAELAWRASRSAAEAVDRGRSSGLVPGRARNAQQVDWDAMLGDFRAAQRRPVILDRVRADTLRSTGPLDTESVVRAADRIVAGRFSYFGYPEVISGSVVDWHRDPFSGRRWPLVPARQINHRRHQDDPKWIWELNRLQHLPWLAQAYLFTGEDRYAECALGQLDAWVDANPPGMGIAWRGAFEVGIRAISVVVALQGLRDADALDVSRFRKVVEVLADGARRSWTHRSLFSSANNHLIGELAGVVAVALMFPELRHASMWEDRAVRALAGQAAKQILPDGSGAEQAVAYQIFSADLLIVVAVLLRRAGRIVPPEIVTAIERSTDYLSALVGPGEPAPVYGDNDDGFALRLGAEGVRTVHDHLGTARAVLFGAGRTPRTDDLDPMSAWLADDSGLSDPGRTPTRHEVGEGFHARDGGLVVLRSRRRRVVVDVGPLGYLSIAAHGHADALAVGLTIDGHEVVGDPGTASYYAHPEWRAVHRGTRAHATVCVDDEDQSVAAGAFLWSRHARTQIRFVDVNAGVVEAEHDGYRRLQAPVRHRRWVLAPPDHDTVLVVDLLYGDSPTHGAVGDVHHVRCSWPIHPELTVLPTPSGHLVHRAGERVLQLAYAATADLVHEEVRGDESTHLGWWSRQLESRQPSWLVGAACRAATPVVLVTALHTTVGTSDGSAESETDLITALTVYLDPHRITVGWADGGLARSVILDLARPGGIERSIDGDPRQREDSLA